MCVRARVRAEKVDICIFTEEEPSPLQLPAHLQAGEELREEGGGASSLWALWKDPKAGFHPATRLSFEMTPKTKPKDSVAMKKGSRFLCLGHDKIGRQFRFCGCY